MGNLTVQDYVSSIKRIAKEHGATNLRVFGSYARGEAGPASDLDLLIDLEAGRDLLDLIGLKQDLEEIIGREVDVVTEKSLSPHIRQQIISEAKAL